MLKSSIGIYPQRFMYEGEVRTTLSIDRCPGNDTMLKIRGVQPSCAAFCAQALYVMRSNIHAASSPPRGSRGIVAPLFVIFVRPSLHYCLEACLRHFMLQSSFQGCRLIVLKTLGYPVHYLPKVVPKKLPHLSTFLCTSAARVP